MKNMYVIFWSLTAALSGFLFGFDTAVISGAEQAVQRLWKMDDFTHGMAISMALWGTVLGALLGGIPCDKYGRKPTLLWIGVFYAVSAIGSALAWDTSSFMIFRFIGGLAVGASSIAAPAYITEIAPENKRGRLVITYQLNIVIGILVAFVSNYLFGGMEQNSWRWMMGVEVVPAVFFTLMVLVLPESPRWLLLKRGNERAARAILIRSDPENVDNIIEDIAREEKNVSLKSFFTKKYSRPITLAILLALFNQLSGINAVLYYAPRIFEMTGSNTSVSLMATIGIGVANLIFTGMGLVLIDRLGRKRLMLIGSIGYIFSLSMIAVGFVLDSFEYLAIYIVVFIASHAVGQGAVIWVYITEIFSNTVRSRGQAVGCGTHWIMAGAITLVMPYFLNHFGGMYIFSFFAAMMVLQLLFVVFLMVETKDRSLEELSMSLLKTG